MRAPRLPLLLAACLGLLPLSAAALPVTYAFTSGSVTITATVSGGLVSGPVTVPLTGISVTVDEGALTLNSIQLSMGSTGSVAISPTYLGFTSINIDFATLTASSGTLVYPDGRTKSLSQNDVTVAVLNHWTSPASGARYPAKWAVTVPSLQLDIQVTPLMANQELATRRSTQVTYWEGAVQISGTAEGRAVTGQGYVELTGYAEQFMERL